MRTRTPEHGRQSGCAGALLMIVGSSVLEQITGGSDDSIEAVTTVCRQAVLIGLVSTVAIA